MSLFSFIAQKYIDWELAPRSAWSRILIPRQVSTALRLALIRCGDPLIEFSLDGFRLTAPLSHQLPFNRQRLPFYSENVGRLAQAVARKYPDATFIDIGANIGDTAAILSAHVRRPILSIEGHPQYLRLLRANLARIGGDVEVAETYVGGQDGLVTASVATDRGTAAISATAGAGETVSLRTLRSVLDDHVRFARSKLVKIDTDGFDCEIIESQSELLRSLKPVLFFEYDPHLFAPRHPPSYTVFPTLTGLGYSRFMFYTNEGDYLASAASAASADAGLLHDLDRFYRGRGSSAYCDIAAFHGDDTDLADEFRRTELAFFERHRAG